MDNDVSGEYDSYSDSDTSGKYGGYGDSDLEVLMIRTDSLLWLMVMLVMSKVVTVVITGTIRKGGLVGW